MEQLVYWMLGLTSVAGLTVIVERGFALRWHKAVPPAITAAVRSCKTRHDLPMLRRTCEAHKAPLSRLLLLAAEHLDWPKQETVDALETQARYEVVKLERGLVVIEIIVGIAPLIGLVGTIAGMMALFGDLGVTGLGDATKLAKGIGLILNATLIGLLIAIPSLIAWSYFSRKVEMLAAEMECLCDEFIRRQYRDTTKS